MKRIILSSLVILGLIGGVVAATIAQFSDTETSVGNTFSAGTLNLTADNKEGAAVVHITRDNMKPQARWTYQGYNQQWILKNTGNLPGTLSVTIKNVENFENGCTTPETVLGDLTTCGTGPDQGELGQYTWVNWSKNGGTATGTFSGTVHFDPLNTANGVVVTGPVIQPDETFNAYMWLDFPRRVDDMENLAQGDSLKFDIEFKLVQIP